MHNKNFTFVNKLAQTIYDKKGSNILSIDVSGFSSICDTILIAEGNVERHVIAIARSLIQEAKLDNKTVFCQEGLSEGDWVILDLGDVHIHLFTPEVRQKYQIETLFQEAPLIDLSLDLEERQPIGIM
jgi:ribosome-associated protein